MEGQRAGEGGAWQKSFPRDQERSISTIRYFVSSARLLCGRPYKKKLREGGSSAVAARAPEGARRRAGGRGEGEGRESLEGYPPAVPRERLG